MFSFSTLSHDESYHLLDTIAFLCIQICSSFCAFPVREKVGISSINAYAYFCGKYSSSNDFLKFNSLSTQSFHAWLISEFMTYPDVEYDWLHYFISHISTFNENWERLHHQNDTFLFLFSIYTLAKQFIIMFITSLHRRCPWGHMYIYKGTCSHILRLISVNSQYLRSPKLSVEKIAWNCSCGDYYTIPFA